MQKQTDREVNIQKANQMLFNGNICQAIYAFQNIINKLLNEDPEMVCTYKVQDFGNVQNQKGIYQHHIACWYQQQIRNKQLQPNPFTALSLCYSHPTRIYEGRVWYETKVAEHKDVYHLAYGLANSYYNSNLVNQAHTMYLKCIQIDPQCSKAYQGIALICFYKYQQDKQAMKYALKALELNQNDVNVHIIVAKTQSKQAKRMEALVNLKTKEPTYFSKIQHLIGITLSEEGKIEQAVSHFISSLENYEYVSPILCLANISILYNCYEKSQQLAHWSLKLQPSNFETLITLGYACLLQEKYIEAGQWLYAATQVKDNHYILYYYLGVLNYEQGDYEEAIQYFQKALQLNKGCKEIHLCLCGCYSGGGQFKTATEHMLQYATNEPDNADVQFELGRIYFQRQMYKQSLLMFEMFIANQKNDYTGLFMIGCCHLNLGDDHKSQEFFRKSVELNDHFSDGWLALACLDFQQQDTIEGLNKIDKVLNFDSDCSEALQLKRTIK